MSHLVQLASLMAATTTKKSSSSIVPLLVIVAVAAGGYFFFLRPQQQKARAARQQNSDISVGDEVQTIGGIVGRVTAIENDRVTLISGDRGAGAQPTEIVLVRQAIARRLTPGPTTDAGRAEDHDGISYGYDDHDDEVHDQSDHESGHDGDDGEDPDEDHGAGRRPTDRAKDDEGS
jgi:preprotein translocase subunit YajC